MPPSWKIDCKSLTYILVLVIMMAKADDQRKVKITVSSLNCALDQCGESCGSHIIIDGKQHSPKLDGMNIAILNPFTGVVVISASFSSARSKNFEDFIRTTKDGYVVIATSQLLCKQEMATNLRRQKAIIFGFKKLGANVTIQPVLYRSGIYIFCKNGCYGELEANIDLPFSKFRKSSEDPILVSFTMNVVPCLKRLNCIPDAVKPTLREATRDRAAAQSPVESTRNEKDEIGTSLLLVASIAPLVIVGIVTTLLFLYIRRRYRREGVMKEKKIKSKPGFETKVPSERRPFCECRKQTNMAESSENKPLVSDCDSIISSPQAKVKHTSSFRLFHNMMDDTDQPNPRSNFATYVTFGNSGDDDHDASCLYKAPSSVKRHAPPTDLPPGCRHSEQTTPEDYLDMAEHDYASLDDVGFISSTGAVYEQADCDAFTSSVENSGEQFLTDLSKTEMGACTGYNKAKELYERASISLKSANDIFYDYEDYMHPIDDDDESTKRGN